MLGQIWKWLAAGAAAAATVLYFLWRIADGQKEAAQAKADREEAKRKGVEATQETERDIDQSVNKERERAEEIERENREQESSGGRPDSFGDDRLK